MLIRWVQRVRGNLDFNERPGYQQRVAPTHTQQTHMDKYEFTTPTRIGKLFGVSHHRIGKWLDELDLRYHISGTAYPTPKAIDQGLAKWKSLQYGGYYLWHLKKTVAVLRQAGHQTTNEAMLAEFRASKSSDPNQHNQSEQ